MGVCLLFEAFRFILFVNVKIIIRRNCMRGTGTV